MPFTRSIVGGGMFTLTISCGENFVDVMDRLIDSNGAGTGMEGTLFDSSSSLLGSCGSAGFNGIGCSSFDLIEKDTDAAWKRKLKEILSKIEYTY